MPSTPITDHPDLTPVFGRLDDEHRDRIDELLTEAHARLAETHEHLSSQGTWHTEGVVITTEISGQASVDVLMEESAGKLTFEAQLRPSNYFPSEEAMWQPGRPPLVMATDGWDVDGAVSVRFRTRVAGRPYTIQEQVRQIEEARYDAPVAAAEAFAKVCEKLAKLATSREATVEAWKPDAGA
jgi:hypothetical protein